MRSKEQNTCFRAFILVFWSLITLSFFFPAMLNGLEYLNRLLPAAGEAPGWQLAGKPESAAGDDLFMLIDGGAEIYQEYGFARALTCIFRHSSGSEVNVEIYEMADAAAAYGVYSFKRGAGGRPIAVGQEATLENYYLNMWTGNFLVILTGLDQKAETVAGLAPLASAIAAKIPATGKRPEIVNTISGWLTEKPRFIYLKGRLALFNLYPIFTRGMSSFREGILAKYTGFDLLLLSYAAESDSGSAFSSWGASLSRSPDIQIITTAQNRIAFTDRKGIRTAVESFGNHIAILIHPAGRAPDANLDSLKQKLSTSLQPPLPVPE